jgi:hypothetical protein
MTLLPNIIDVVDVPYVAQWREPEGFEPTPSPAGVIDLAISDL